MFFTILWVNSFNNNPSNGLCCFKGEKFWFDTIDKGGWSEISDHHKSNSSKNSYYWTKRTFAIFEISGDLLREIEDIRKKNPIISLNDEYISKLKQHRVHTIDEDSFINYRCHNN
jgi:mRNA-degrading endonuclease HigB of HigAB toxin-antitoxin module